MKLLRYVLAAFALICVAPASAASLIGQTMDVSYRFPDVASVYPFATASPASFVVGPGQESVIDVEGVTDINVYVGASTMVVDFATVLSSPTWNATSFNGLLFQGPGAARIASATIIPSVTTMAGFDDSRLYLSGGAFGLNWQGLSYVTGTTVGVEFKLVPEPSTWAMLLVGFGAIGAVLRRRRLPAHATPSLA